MKVVILGPAIQKNKSGGVAVFDEGLYKGFQQNGDEVFLISVGKSASIENICLSKKGNESKFSCLKFFGKIAKKIKELKPDLVISSLLYSLGVKKYKRAWKNATYVSVLHGFPCAITGFMRTKAVNYVARFSKKHFDKVVTVSFLSYAINKRIYKINCDHVIINGCDFPPVLEIKKDKKYDFVFVGRLTRSKEIEMICDAFLLASKENPNLRFAVAGYSDLENLFINGKYSNTPIEFLGKLSSSDVSELFQSSKFFISMNSLEPFGIVFAEALMNGCNVITESTAGCASTFIKNDFFHIADCSNSDALKNCILDIYPNYVDISKESRERLAQEMSLKKMAEEYRKLAFLKNK